jgi:hypothetical protein
MRSLVAVLWILASTNVAGGETFEQRWTATVEALFLRDSFDDTTGRLGFAPTAAMAETPQLRETPTVKAADEKADGSTTQSVRNAGLRSRARGRSRTAGGYRRCTGHSWCTTSCSKAAKGSRQAEWCASMKRGRGSG